MTPEQHHVDRDAPHRFDYDVIIVGAGFAGLYALHRMRELGLSARVLERGDGVGGVWFWNRYPGARCDIESIDYSYSFSPELEQEWQWTERYASQPEILRYLNHVADRFDLRRDIQLRETVTGARYDEASKQWAVETAAAGSYRCQFLICGSGVLSSRLNPDDLFHGLDSFLGSWYQTAAWPVDGVDFSGKRVAVVGTGSTGIQIIPQIAKQAAHLYVCQRTASYSVPARNAPLASEALQAVRARYREYRRAARLSAFGVPSDPPTGSAIATPADERRHEYEKRWQIGGGPTMLAAFADLLVNEESNETAADFVRTKIHEIVADPQVADMLCPTSYPIGTKRICVDIGYYETFNRENVTLVSVLDNPIVKVTAAGLLLAEGQELELDAIVFAIGFDAITGALLDINPNGRQGVALRKKWSNGPASYLGLMVAGFPNMFTVTGPGSPSVLSNMVVSIEQHVDWITAAIAGLLRNGQQEMEPTPEAEEAWGRHVAELSASTLFSRANSWYVGANVPGKPRVFIPYVGGVGPYWKTIQQIADDGYEGFTIDGAAKPYRRSHPGFLAQGSADDMDDAHVLAVLADGALPDLH